ncbi:amino acid adenylation domain-containing protein [Allocatelliglobosispora scoriae]|uniref:Amino acid adenylation domain-containing protein n=1 Tax=Allocatelliglobosispora scoriae TaxID=643052 RepID=A0A841BQ11_9ACTN|nr:non-ribosomal peptide synthetase [Allocatelliglobosispora scoriae]MBB5869386.1 amino acid adenylation domain-containing protein [Allocatelliglobosispora scoriae]
MDGIVSTVLRATPASFGQERIWLASLLDPGSTDFTILAPPFRAPAGVTPATLQAALAAIVARHEALRTSLRLDGDTLVQVVHAVAPLPPLRETDLRGLDADEVTARASVLVDELLAEPLPLHDAPLWRSWLLRIADDRWTLFFAAHHAIFDATSINNIYLELVELCAADVERRPAVLPELRLQYADATLAQRADTALIAAQLDYWREALAGLPLVHGVPTDRPRPADDSYATEIALVPIAAGINDEVNAVARQWKTSPFVVLLTAYVALLARLSGQSDVVVGIPVAGRGDPDLEPLIGMFVNTLVARVDASGDPTLEELADRVRDTMVDAWRHQDAPFQHVVEALAPPRDTGVPPLYQLSFNYLPQTGTGDTPNGGAHEDLSLTMSLDQLRINYNVALFDEASVLAFGGRYLRVVAAMVDEELRLSELPLLGAVERRQVTEEFNDTEADFPAEETLASLVEAQAARTPDAPAVVLDGRTLSYAELNASANRVAHRLRALGAAPGTLIGVYAHRSPELVAGLLGVVKAGAAYVPLDPDYPSERLAFMVEDSGATILLTAGAADAPPSPVVLRLDDPAQWADQPTTDPEGERAGPADPAYMIYTSGSTGRPKGVPNTHRAIVNRLDWMQKRYQIDAADTVLQKTPASFDVSVWEFFWPLITGARLVLMPPGEHRDPAAVRDLIVAEGVTTLHFVPSMLAAFLGAGRIGSCTSLRRVICSGEELPADLARRLLDRLPWTELHNLYGPTEAAVDVSAWQCRPGDPGPVPIGAPIQNIRLFVLDEQLEPVPIGTAGQLYIGGVGIAEGYHRRPELTAERFLQTRFGRLYATGDLAKWRADGNLVYLGRLDHQVKLRGQRIELGEIETVLRAQPEVTDAVVLLREDVPGDQRIVAYVVGRADAEALGKTLPAYMVPSVFVPVDRLPVTANGKLDRAALPVPEAGGPTREHVEPRTETERQVALAWSEVLGVDRIGAHDDFFGLGGHSLLATRALARLAALTGVEVPLRAMFSASSVAGFARVLDERADTPAQAPITRRDQAEAPLTAAQERLWFLHRYDPADIGFNVPIVRRLRGPLDVAALDGALADVVARHDAIRTEFPDRDGTPAQVVRPDARVVIDRADAADEQAGRALATELASRPFDLTAAPLLRVTLIRLGDDDHLLCAVTHHIVSDGVSMNVFLDELATGYSARVIGTTPSLPDLPVQYADFAAWQRDNGVGEQGAAYWRNQLADAPVLDLPTDHPRPPVRSGRGAMVTHRVPGEVADRFTRIAAESGCTPFMGLLAAYQVLLGRHAGQDDVCVGSPVAGRDRVELEPLIGYFLNTVVLRGDLSGDPTLRELLARTREVALRAFSYQDIPFERLMAELRVDRDTSRTPLFQAMFTLQNQGAEQAPFHGLDVRMLTDLLPQARCDLTLEAWREPSALHTQFVYAAELFDAETVAGFARRFARLLDEWSAAPDLPLSAVSLGDEPDRAWTTGPVGGTPHGTVLDEFVAQVAETPQAVALHTAGESITYAELDARADRLAGALLVAGAGAESLVGVCLDRSAELVVTLLAIWKAGAAYLPLDPAYPADRIAYLLSDGGARLVVSDRELPGVTVLAPDAVGPAPHGEPPSLDDLAYVIYTSGSTGQPKGVEVAHRAVASRVAWMREGYAITPADRVLLFASVSFDTHVEEVFPALTAGAGLVLPPTASAHLTDFLTTPAAAALTVLDLPTPYWHELVADPHVTWPASLRLVILGADQVRAQAVAAWRERFGDRVRLINSYGPTEATIIATTHELGAADALRQPPIGRPIADTVTLVLDAALREVPVGSPGELCIGGAGLARGYLRRPELTSARFVDHPAGRLYRTGDRVRWRPDGTLEFLGRLDDQVKLRGYRIEPGEVEAVLLDHPHVALAAVVVRKDSSDLRLVGYFVGAATVEQVREHLARRLPAHMVPDALMPLDALPLTPNGKLDRRALPAPAVAADRPFQAPAGASQELVAAVWAEVLGVDRIGAHDDFFGLGGHSLLATRVIARLSANVELAVPIHTIFDHPTVAGLADAVEQLLLAELGELSDEEAAMLLAADDNRR